MPRPTFGGWLDDHGTHFRIWAPSSAHVDLLIDGEPPRPLAPEARGVFGLDLASYPAGTRYRFRLDDRDPIPDPASRWQPDGVHGASALDDPRAFIWRASPIVVSMRDLVIYELHVGTFTPEGSFDAARARLPYLRELGVTAVEVMPVAEFPGTRNWGYDGAALFAASSVYGGPRAFRAFVDEAHALGLVVILDIVYNHVGPDGAYLHAASPAFFTKDAASPWGDAVDIGHPVVRDWLIANAVHWAVDFQIDGFRLDATHALPHRDAPAFIRALVDETRAAAGRPLLFIAEDHRRLPEMIEADAPGSWGLDAVWADDFHHHVRVMTAGDAHGYFSTYSGTAPELAATMAAGWHGLPAATVGHERFVICIQNHDQIGNRARGDRLHHAVPLDVYRAASALLLLAPETPLLFMGQEWAASTPFQYFTDHHGELGRLVSEGRRREFRDFPDFTSGHIDVPDPQEPSTFDASTLDIDEASGAPHAGVLALYRELIALRRRATRRRPEVNALDASTVAVRYDDIAIVARLTDAGEPAAPAWLDASWQVLLTTEDAPFTHKGLPPTIGRGHLQFARPSAVVLTHA